MSVLLIDNYDSFTYMLKDYIEQCGVSCTVIRNDEPQLRNSIEEKYTHIILSPGPSTPKESGFLMTVIENSYSKFPILGVCLGHQAIGQFFGASLQHAALPKHGKIDNVMHTEDLLFSQIPTRFKATRYHSLILSTIPESIKVIANTEQDEIMAIRHISLPIWGIQFHPESCLTENGLQLIQNFLLYDKGKY